MSSFSALGSGNFFSLSSFFIVIMYFTFTRSLTEIGSIMIQFLSKELGITKVVIVVVIIIFPDDQAACSLLVINKIYVINYM